ncbi:MAG TPA: hypothetical protein VL463_14060, partial [Kofleriaceae bacterium]|nr:hypothetical protein [Kofleriaceae bacterium]
MRGSTTFMSCAAAAALLGASAPAHAQWDDDHEDSGEHDPWEQMRFEGDVGFLVGGMSIGPLDGFAGGMYAMGGIRRDRLALFGEYDLLSVGDTPASESADPNAPPPPDPVRGYMQRAGFDVRYSVGKFGGGDESVRGDIWIEGGAGGEVIQWYDGGRLHRGDVDLGFGAQATFKIGSDSHPRYIGFHYAVKGFVAKAPPRKDDFPTCAGPCDEPTPPVPYDTGIFFNFGVVL